MSHLRHNADLNVNELCVPSTFHRGSLECIPCDLPATKIVATIGPSCQNVETLKQMICSGMSVARLNFLHGSEEFHSRSIDCVREAARQCFREGICAEGNLGEMGEDRQSAAVAIALDTKGPEIRTGKFMGGEALVSAGSVVELSTNVAEFELGTRNRFFVDYVDLPRAVQRTQKVFVDDGNLQLDVTEVDEVAGVVTCRAYNDHRVTDCKGVNLPWADLDLPAVSEKDKKDIRFGVEHGVDYIFASFIRNAGQVRDVKALLPDGNSKNVPRVIAKIENGEGLRNLDEIIEAADGVMVARGDLGVEIEPEYVFLAQKKIIARCNFAGKSVICATQMLESMILLPRPTRAETCDVANAVWDGTDAVMLSGETAKGKYPVEAVRRMAAVCRAAEHTIEHKSLFGAIKDAQTTPFGIDEAVACSAVMSVLNLNAKLLVVLSTAGNCARLVGKYRPNCPMVVVSKREESMGGFALVRGAVPVFYDIKKYGEDHDCAKRVHLGVHHALKCKLVQVVTPHLIAVVVHADAQTHGFANLTRCVEVSGEFIVPLERVDVSTERL